VSRACTRVKDLGTNASSVVTYPQPKLFGVVSDLHLDPRSLRVLEGIPYCLASNAIDIVPQDRSEVPWCAFHVDAKVGNVRVRLICEFRAERPDRSRKVVCNNRGGTEALHRIATLGDRLPGLLDGPLSSIISASSG